MDDLKSVTVSYLRELARKHLGPGHSKLTKTELIAALAQFVPALKKLARIAGVELPGRSKPAAQAAPSASKPSRAREAPSMKKKEPEKKAAERKKEPEKKAAPERKKEPEKKAAERKKEPEKKAAAPRGRKPEPSLPAPAKAEDVSQSQKPAHVVNFPRRSRAGRAGDGTWEDATEVAGPPEQEAALQHPAEPLVEGFFVARMVGERELRRHHLTEDQASRVEVGGIGYEENLGELPLDYGNDLALALARDPHTLFITWDFSAASRARAAEGLEEARAVLRVFEGDRLVREQEIALESRSFYIHGLPPGRPYRVEAHLVDRAGRSRRIGSSTHPVTLPQTGVSPDTSVRFMQMPPPVPATSGAPAAPAVVASGPWREEQLEVREYITWQRVPLPGSADAAELMQRRRESTSRRVGEEEAGPREHLELPLRPPGSSEQSAGGGPGRGGASEQTHWTPPPSGRGR
ncbi:MAG: DUF4912 domain-containing protein [Myxococcaceae bacterium]|nr:DUF4912 domain-containing protein [Myxococcaceae bacterium]